MDLSPFSKEKSEGCWELSSPSGLMFQTNIDRGNHLSISSFWCYDFNPFKQITLSIWEEIDSLISYDSWYFLTWRRKLKCVNFLDKRCKNLDSSLKQERKDLIEKLISMYVPTLREHELVSWWVSFLFHCIQYTSIINI